MRVILLGATGQVGSMIHKVISAAHPEWEVLAAVRDESKVKKGAILFRPFADDWGLIGKTDVIINSIGIIEETKEMDFEKAHIGLTKLLLANRKKTGDPLLIQMSVLGAEKELGSRFLSTKKAADELLLAEQNTYIIRPSIVCTPNTMIVQKFRMIRRISRLFFGRMPFPSGFLAARIQPVMGEDVAGVACRLAEAPQEQRIIELVGPEVMTIRELLEGMDPRIKMIGFSQKLFNKLFAFSSRLFPKVMNKEQFILLQTDNVGDKTIAEKLLGRAMHSTRKFWKEELGQ